MCVFRLSHLPHCLSQLLHRHTQLFHAPPSCSTIPKLTSPGSNISVLSLAVPVVQSSSIPSAKCSFLPSDSFLSSSPAVFLISLPNHSVNRDLLIYSRQSFLTSPSCSCLVIIGLVHLAYLPLIHSHDADYDPSWGLTE